MNLFKLLLLLLLLPLSVYANPSPLNGSVSFKNCSGSVIRFSHQSKTDFALILTNGHCSGLPFSTQDPLIDIPSQEGFRLRNREGKSFATNAQRLLFATMTHTDLALYQLSITYEDLEQIHKLDAFTLREQPPQAHEEILIISGYWLHIFQCSIEAIVPTLQEANNFYTGSLRYSEKGCETQGGFSGAPIVASNSRDVIAIHNTTNAGETPCSLNNACEYEETEKIATYTKRGYAQQVTWLYSCMDKNGNLDFKVASCSPLSTYR